MITICRVTGDADLASTRNWHHQDGVQVILDIPRGELGMSRHFVWDTLRAPGQRRWVLPLVPRAEVANAILDEIAPLAERVLAGDETAAREIEDYLATVKLTDEQRAFAWDAFYDAAYDPVGVPEVTADMSDEDLQAMIETYAATAAVNVDGWFEYLVSERDRARAVIWDEKEPVR